MDIFKKYIQDPKNPWASIPNPNYYGSLGTGQVGQKADTSFLQGLVRRSRPAGTSSSLMSLGEYLKTQLPQATQYPSSQYTPLAQTPTAPVLPASQSYFTSMDNRITAGQMPPSQEIPPVKEEPPTIPKTPFVPGMPDEARTIYTQRITKKGVYMDRMDQFGNLTSTFERENRPGDITEGEIYTYQKEWRPLSTEYQQGKGEMSFAPRQQFANLIKNQ